jgi:hypothetical protein
MEAVLNSKYTIRVGLQAPTDGVVSFTPALIRYMDMLIDFILITPTGQARTGAELLAFVPFTTTDHVYHLYLPLINAAQANKPAGELRQRLLNYFSDFLWLFHWNVLSNTLYGLRTALLEDRIPVKGAFLEIFDKTIVYDIIDSARDERIALPQDRSVIDGLLTAMILRGNLSLQVCMNMVALDPEEDNLVSYGDFIAHAQTMKKYKAQLNPENMTIFYNSRPSFHALPGLPLAAPTSLNSNLSLIFSSPGFVQGLYSMFAVLDDSFKLDTYDCFDDQVDDILPLITVEVWEQPDQWVATQIL